MAFLFKDKIKGYRIADRRHSIYSGAGAERYGGRWNPVGRQVIYASENLSGAVLEILVHLNETPLPNTHVYIEIFSEDKIALEKVESHEFKVWDIYDDFETKQYADLWLEERRSAVLIVPSIVIPEQKNLVLNPNHPDFDKLKISKPKLMNWDHRLF